MSLTEGIIAGVTSLVGFGIGAYLSPLLRGTPPKSRAAWTEIDEKIDRERKGQK